MSNKPAPHHFVLLNHRVFYGIVLFLLGLIGYGNIHSLGFLNIDDSIYVYSNEHVRRGLSLETISWAFTTVEAEFWHPLTWLSLMLDTTLYGVNPAGYHVTNLFLHIFTGIFLFLAFDIMTGMRFRAMMLGAFFILHPVHVESVAWIAERKEVLCGFFGTFALVAYAVYNRRQKWTMYWMVLMLFILGLMSKPMIVTFPILLLLMDIWPLKRYIFLKPGGQEASLNQQGMRFLLWEKTPFFLISTVFIGLTIYAQHHGGGIVGLDIYPLGARIGNAIVSYQKYLLKILMPMNLSIFYPFPTHIQSSQIIISLLALFLITWMAAINALKKPYLIVGWAWFIVSLTPVIGIIKIGDFAMADRYLHMPMAGVVFALIWLGADWFDNRRTGRMIAGLLAAVMVMAAGWGTRKYLDKWKDPEMLFLHAAATTSKNFYAHYILGHIYMGKGRADKAEYHFKTAGSMRPDKQFIKLDLGRLMAVKGKFSEAVTQFQAVIQKNPTHREAHYYLGLALLGEKKEKQALSHLMESISMDHDQSNRVKLLYEHGNHEQVLRTLSINASEPELKKSMARGYQYFLQSLDSTRSKNKN